MKLLFFLFISNICFAADWGKYEYNGFNPFKDNVFHSLNLELEDEGFNPTYLANLKKDNGFGFNQVYFDDYLRHAIYLKYDIIGKLKFNQLHTQGKNSIYHFKDQDSKIYGVSLINFSPDQAKKIVYKIKTAVLNAKVVRFKNNFLNFFTGSAYARPIPHSEIYDRCMAKDNFNELANSKDMQELYAQTSAGHLMNCLKEIGGGFSSAPASLYELGKSIYNSVVNISLSKIVDTTKQFVRGVKSFSMAIVNNWGSIFQIFSGQLKQLFEEIKLALSSLNPEQIRTFFCTMIGQIGFGALVGLFTAGVGSLAMVARIAQSAKAFLERFKVNTYFLDKYLEKKKNKVLDSKTTSLSSKTVDLDKEFIA